MEYLENRHSFAAVIGDIKDSRKLENRKEVQKASAEGSGPAEQKV